VADSVHESWSKHADDETEDADGYLSGRISQPVSVLRIKIFCF